MGGGKQHRERLDEYERRFMGGHGALARDRVHMAPWAHALFAAIALTVAFTAAPRDPGALLALAILSFVWLVVMTVRVVVTDEHVHVQLGVFGPRIPLDAIVSAAPEAHSAWSFGIRVAPDGTVTYSVPSFSAKHVVIEYRKGDRLRRMRVMCREPQVLCRAIERGRAQRGMFRQMVQIGGLPGDVDVHEADE